MENLNAEQIKYALGCCQFRHIKKNCDECKYHRWIEPACRDLICQDALALINSQEQKIFELENRLKECENGYEGTLHLESCKLHEAEEKVKELTKELEATFGQYTTYQEVAIQRMRELTEENERLKSVEFTCGFVKPHKVLECPIFDEIERTKADTVRKMQERLKACFGTYVLGYKIPLTEALKAVDQIAKEMLEDTK